MRGSPLIRTLFVLIALVLTGFGLGVLNAKRQAEAVPAAVSDTAGDPELIPTPFVLTLSAKARMVSLESGGKTITPSADSQTITGSLFLETGHPGVFIDIHWADPDPSPRFAKLVLEPAGLPTQTRIFDSVGDLSDVWEPHVHHDDHE